MERYEKDDFYKRFCKEEFDANGVLCKFEPVVAEHYNFAFDVVGALAEEEPDKRALIWCNPKGEERTFTFSQIDRYVNKTANFLKSLGIGKGDYVMLVLKRHYQFWFSILALNKLGAVAIPATNQLMVKDYIYRFQAADVKAIICTADGECAGLVEQAQQEYGCLEHKILVGGKRDGWYDFNEEIEAYPDTVERYDTHWSDPMLLYFTSGTTGYPKMVRHDNTYSLGHIITAQEWQCVEPSGVHLTISDTGWGKAAWGKLYGQWIMRTTIFVYDFDKFDPADMLGIISKYKISSFCAPPTMFRFFIKEGMERYDLSALKHAAIAGEALNPEVFHRFYEYTGLKLMEGFGQTESTMIIGNLRNTTPKPGSMGKPSPMYDVVVCDEAGNPVETGEVGEICIRADRDRPQIGLFSGYYKDDARTDEVWNHGLYHTRDTAWVDEDGYIWYVGRTDDVIKASGYRIGPFEIESVLMEHPSVLECAVTGAPDPIRGQVVKATVVLAKGFAASETLKKELQNYVKHQTAPYKYPRIVEFVEDLPKTISGKIKRVDLREKSNECK